MSTNKALKICKIILIVFYLFKPQISSAKDQSLIEIKVDFEKKTYFISEPIVANITITNSGTSSVSFDCQHLNFSTEVEIKIEAEDKNKIEIYKQKAGLAYGMVTSVKIQPNSSYKYDLMINNYIKFKETGIFKFKFSYTIHYEAENSPKFNKKEINQNIELEILPNDIVALDKIFGDLYQDTLSIKKEKLDSGTIRLCAVTDPLVLKYLELMAQSKDSAIKISVFSALEKFGKEAKPSLEKIIKDPVVGSGAKSKAADILKKLE